MSTLSSPVADVSTRRRAGFYVAVGLFTLLLAAFGTIPFPLYLDGIRVFVDPNVVNSHVVHHVPDLLVFGLPLVVMALQLWQPTAKAAGIQQTVLMMGIFAVGSILFKPSYIPVPITFLVLALAAGVLHPARNQIFSLPRQVNLWALALAALALVVITPFAVEQFQAQANAVPAVDEHAEFGHWLTSGLLVLNVPLLAALGSTTTPGRRIPAYSAAGAAILFGLISILHPLAASSLGTAGGALAIVWALLYLVASEVRRPGRSERP